ncbi:hypothetical protein BST61_g5770 [Cercospora zeina]
MGHLQRPPARPVEADDDGHFQDLETDATDSDEEHAMRVDWQGTACYDTHSDEEDDPSPGRASG